MHTEQESEIVYIRLVVHVIDANEVHSFVLGTDLVLLGMQDFVGD